MLHCCHSSNEQSKVDMHAYTTLFLLFYTSIVQAWTTSSKSASKNSLLPCPSTVWPSSSSFTTADITIPDPRLVPFLKSIRCPPANIDSEIQWLQENANDLKAQLVEHGALYFQGFDITRSQKGFRHFVELLQFQPCQDALEDIGIRALLDSNAGVYKAVDSESLAQTFIGLHNDCTFALAPPYAAFCCFQPATLGGGEFLVADGREIFRQLNLTLMEPMIQRGVRVRVAAIPTPFLRSDDNNANDSLPAQLVQGIVRWGLKTFLPKLGLELGFNDNHSLLQIMEPLKSPVNFHPKTGHATFFSGVHSQSTYLQQQRSADAFEGVATTDVFYGERNGRMDPMEPNVLDHIESVMNQHTHRVLMEPGDVVLLDSYQVLHGRDIFQGQREHGVLWLTSNDYTI